MSAADDLDDFEEVLRGKVLAPCTLGCAESRVRNGTKRGVTVTFRCGQLDPDVNAVLSSPRLSVSYSPSQRVFRVKDDVRGQFQLTRAPRSTDVYLLRFPHRGEKMPWVAERVEVDVDVNLEQRAVFLTLPEDHKAPVEVRLLPAPTPLRLAPMAVTQGDRERVLVPTTVLGVDLTETEAAILTMLSDGLKRHRDVVRQALEELGYPRVSPAAVLGRTKQKLDVEHTFSTDGTTVWLNPWEVDKLRAAVEGRAA